MAQNFLDLYWGDIHGHNELCDGTGTTDEYFQYGRDVSKLDFCSLTPHDIWIEQEKWDFLQKKVKEYHRPGEFVTLLAFEWTARLPQARMFREEKFSSSPHSVYNRVKHLTLEKYGHKNVYFPGEEGRLLSCLNRDSDTVEKLYREVAKEDAIVISHHPAHIAYWTDWDVVDDRFEPVVEIFSTWGSSENSQSEGNPYPLTQAPYYPGTEKHGSFVTDALNRGYKLGFIASGDSHVPTPGKSLLSGSGFEEVERRKKLGKIPRYYNGLIAVYCKTLTREAIMGAIRNRRCYATTGKKIRLDFRLGRFFMGEVAKKADIKNEKFAISVEGTSPLEKIEVVHNGQVMKKITVENDTRNIKTECEVPSKEQMGYYYIRVSQRDREMAWSSPIWIDG